MYVILNPLVISMVHGTPKPLLAGASKLSASPSHLAGLLHELCIPLMVPADVDFPQRSPE